MKFRLLVCLWADYFYVVLLSVLSPFTKVGETVSYEPSPYGNHGRSQHTETARVVAECAFGVLASCPGKLPNIASILIPVNVP
jgi:hypothetical protein